MASLHSPQSARVSNANLNVCTRKSDASIISNLSNCLKLRNIKLAFLVLCVFLFTIFTAFNYGGVNPRDFLSELSCKDGNSPSWICDKAIRIHPEVQPPLPPTSIPMTSTRECPGLYVDFPLKERETFQLLNGTHIYIYSAFLDGDVVRILGIRERTDNTTFHCHIWADTVDEDPLFTGKAVVLDLPDHHERTYRPIFMVCPLPDKFKVYVRLAVSVSPNKCGSTTTVLPIIKSGPLTSDFITCVPPLKFHYSEAHAIVESIEFKRLLGAKKLVFYNHSVHNVVSKILHNYQSHGLIDVHQWHVPVNVDGNPPQVHTAAQMAANNDCLYRNRGITRYIVVLDIDEFIIPQGPHLHNWTDLMQARLKKNPTANSFQIRNTFFRKEWTSLDPTFVANRDVRRYKSVVLQHFQKESYIWPYKSRSKYICDPKKVKTLGIHFVRGKLEGPEDNVPPDEALVYHYRYYLVKSPKDVNKTRLMDMNVSRKYGLDLMRNVKKAWARLEKETGLQFNLVEG